MDICPHCYGTKEWQGDDCPMCWGKGVLESQCSQEERLDIELFWFCAFVALAGFFVWITGALT